MTLPEPATQDLPASIAVPEGGFSTALLETLVRSIKLPDRRDVNNLAFKMSKATEQGYRDALERRGVPVTNIDRLTYGPVEVQVDETLGDDTILLERVRPFQEPSGPARRVSSELRVKPAERRIPAPATANEVKGLAQQSRLQNEHRSLPNFGAERNIVGRFLEVAINGKRLGTVTDFASQRQLDARTRRPRPGGGLTIPGEGVVAVDKVNSAWVRYIEEHENLGGLTIRVTLKDNGMPNPEVTEYRGVTITMFTEGSTLQDVVQSTVNFTFTDSEVVTPVMEPVNDDLADVWEYAYSNGELPENMPAPV